MRKEYAQELKDLKEKMLMAEKFAEKLPIFADIILERKLTGLENGIKFSERYKKIPLNWGINRYLYNDKSNILNYRGEFDKPIYLFVIYINSCSLFDENENFGLYDAVLNIPIFHRDYSNTTFYVTDENIEALLEVLNVWYIEAGDKLKAYRLKLRAEKLKKELAEIEGNA